jgi:hypothetical protein
MLTFLTIDANNSAYTGKLQAYDQSGLVKEVVVHGGSAVTSMTLLNLSAMIDAFKLINKPCRIIVLTTKYRALEELFTNARPPSNNQVRRNVEAVRKLSKKRDIAFTFDHPAQWNGAHHNTEAEMDAAMLEYMF